jgi:RpiB/LacA/LacB family sugar-phosphate isomerase
MLFLASDHGGYKLKKQLCGFLDSMRVSYKDLGPFEYLDGDDYPEYVDLLVTEMRTKKDNLGVVICKNGCGVSMYANKFKGIRAALSWDPKHAASSKNDDNANVLALPADYIDLETAKRVLVSWVETPFSNEERHIRRVSKVDGHGEK